MLFQELTYSVEPVEEGERFSPLAGGNMEILLHTINSYTTDYSRDSSCISFCKIVIAQMNIRTQLVAIYTLHDWLHIYV